MRHRERDNRDTSTLEWQRHEHKANCSTATTNYSLSQYGIPFWVGTYEAMSDIVVPGFEKRRAKGEVFMNPMSKTFQSRTHEGSPVSYTADGTPCSYSADRSPHGYVIYLMGGQGGHSAPSIDIPRLRTLAGTQAQANVSAPDFEGATFIAELRETISFLRNPVSGWQKFAKRMKGAKGKTPGYRTKSVFEFASDQWLTYRYGVRPLVSEATNFVNAVKVMKQPRPERHTARGRASDTGTSTHVAKNSTGSPTWTATRHTTTSRNVEAESGVLYEVDYSSSFGTRLEDVPDAVWEAIPFSFVFDWFHNLGTFVDAITPKQGVNVLGSWTTITDEMLSYATSQVDDLASGSQNRVLGANGSTTETFVTRNKSRSPGATIGLASKPLPYSGDLGKKRIVDSLALTHQIFLSK